MTRPRSSLVSVLDTPYYHCICRCVRRAWLCGEDAFTGKTFEHRKPWMLTRLKLLTDTFALDLCAYALMSNHYDLVVRLDPLQAKTWSGQEVMARWMRLFRGPEFMRRTLTGEVLHPEESRLVETVTAFWRSRLADLIWFMRCFNEPIACQANGEDNCKGRFWEGRFKSQALLDEGALLTAMVYVDLNPVRAGVAETVLEADFTSAQQRLLEIARASTSRQKNESQTKPKLLSFSGNERQDPPMDLPFNLKDYLDLVESSGRLAYPGKRGVIPAAQPKLLSTLGMDANEWMPIVTQMQRRFELSIGAPHRLRQVAESRGWRWVRGLSAARKLYARANE
ncbi:MAG: hypothetical protein A3H91_15305 [Gammaproteobacteria bacterium RIFCSPLOWO2_02_FULL_61_13]|nr:MAG: hypothetical protein A3H91_15305 [Gammaproteobacteria bacterium RIFCSPLOWO2_02_FULL_61_13]